MLNLPTELVSRVGLVGSLIANQTFHRPIRMLD